MMKDKDEKIAREILKVLYEKFKEDQFGDTSGDELCKKLDDYERKDIVYVADRMDGQLVEVQGLLGKSIGNVRIKAEGIEKLYEDGYETFLDGDERYEILKFLYDLDRDKSGREFATRDTVLNSVDAGENVVDMNIKYLKEKGLVETLGAGRGLFYSRAKITKRGCEKYEAYENDGVEIPRSGTYRTTLQATLGPDEQRKAENLFRDFVELARDEIIIIDRYARQGLYDLLKHVPSGVQINVITSETVSGGNYSQKVQQFTRQHSDIEVRYLPNKDWDFHDRYVIRDREDGWAWGHSFHDSGKKQHTASELKPVNRENIVNQFNSAWKKAKKVV